MTGFHGADRDVVRQILFEHSWSGSETANVLGTGVYFYIDNDEEEAIQHAETYPMGVHDTPSEPKWVLKSSWIDNPDSCFDMDGDDDLIKKFEQIYEYYKKRDNGNAINHGINENKLKNNIVNSFRKFLISQGKPIQMIKQTIWLSNAFSEAVFIPKRPIEKGQCVCVFDIEVLSPPEAV